MAILIDDFITGSDYIYNSNLVEVTGSRATLSYDNPYSMQFPSGTDAYLTASGPGDFDFLNSTETVSIEFYARFDVVAAYDMPIIVYGDAAGHAYDIFLKGALAFPRIQFRIPNGSAQMEVEKDLVYGRWYYFYFAFTNVASVPGKFHNYVFDTVINQSIFSTWGLINGSSNLSNPQNASSPLLMGSGSHLVTGTDGKLHSAYIDNVRISNNVRYTSSVDTGSAPPATYTNDANTKAIWYFNEGSASTGMTASDNSGNDASLVIAINDLSASTDVYNSNQMIYNPSGYALNYFPTNKNKLQEFNTHGTSSNKFQLSDGGSLWKYYNGNGWIEATTESNTASDINTNIDTFDISGSLFVKTYLQSSDSYIDDIQVRYKGRGNTWHKLKAIQ